MEQLFIMEPSGNVTDKSIKIEPLAPEAFGDVLPFVKKIVEAGETYALPRAMDEEALRLYFFQDDHRVFKAVLNGRTVGVYYLRPNQKGGGSHVANAGFMVAEGARGQGVARAMALAALAEAKRLGFEAMQFNFVVSTNEQAVGLWKKLGFVIVGTLPKAFAHPKLGKVDAYVMYRFIQDLSSQGG